MTGGGRGIGKGISTALAKDAYNLAIIFHKREIEARNLASELQQNGANVRIYQCDVAFQEQVVSMVKSVLNDFKRVDVLVNNAGMTTKSSTVNLSLEDWERVIDVNLKGSFLCSQAVIPSMQSLGSGRIINLSSIAGQTGGGIGPHYAAAKSGVIGLTRFMARELGPDGITVNAIAPSGIPSELLSTIGLKPSANRPVGRVGNLEDVAAAVSYLVSDAASYITGQVISVNGGSFIG